MPRGKAKKSQYDRSRYLAKPSMEAADEAADAFLGKTWRAKEGKYFIRMMPSFKVDEMGREIFFSLAQRHFGIPIIGKEDDSVTMDCPLSIGARCIPCEKQSVFKAVGRWTGKHGCAPSKRFVFNVLDVARPDRGVQILEEGKTFYDLLRLEFDDDEMIMDPFEGTNLRYTVLGDKPWRRLKPASNGQCSLEEIHPDALEWALPANLPDLDDVWEFPSLEEQLQTFESLIAATRTQIPAGSGPPREVSDGDDDDDVIDAEIVGDEEEEEYEDEDEYEEEDDEEEEAEEEEEEEEEPAPKPRTRRGKKSSSKSKSSKKGSRGRKKKSAGSSVLERMRSIADDEEEDEDE